MRYLSGVDRKLKQLSADRHFVVPPQMSLQALLQALLQAANGNGNLQIETPSLGAAYAWGTLDIAGLRFRGLLARREIERADTPAEVRLIAQRGGQSDVCHVRLASPELLEGSASGQSPVSAGDAARALAALLDRFGAAVGARAFDGQHYAWEDDVSADAGMRRSSEPDGARATFRASQGRAERIEMAGPVESDLASLSCDRCGARRVGKAFLCEACGFDMLTSLRARAGQLIEGGAITVPIHQLSRIQLAEAEVLRWREETGEAVPPLSRVATKLGMSEDQARPFLRAAVAGLASEEGGR
jgi:hypothetical protein